MDSISAFLNSQPFIVLFLVIGLGYAAGRVCIGGFSLGSGAVLFIGLAVGAIAPKAAPPGLLGSIGLVVFLYGMGIQYGKDFFRGLASPFGIKANILGAVAVVAGCAVALWTARIMGFGVDFAAGMFGGTMTSTASLQAALDAGRQRQPGHRLCDRLPLRCPRTHFVLLPVQDAVEADDRPEGACSSGRCRSPSG